MESLVRESAVVLRNARTKLSALLYARATWLGADEGALSFCHRYGLFMVVADEPFAEAPDDAGAVSLHVIRS